MLNTLAHTFARGVKSRRGAKGKFYQYKYFIQRVMENIKAGKTVSNAG